MTTVTYAGLIEWIPLSELANRLSHNWSRYSTLLIEPYSLQPFSKCAFYKTLKPHILTPSYLTTPTLILSALPHRRSHWAYFGLRERFLYSTNFKNDIHIYSVWKFMPHEAYIRAIITKINRLMFKKVIRVCSEKHMKNLTTLSEKNGDFSLLLRQVVYINTTGH